MATLSDLVMVSLVAGPSGCWVQRSSWRFFVNQLAIYAFGVLRPLWVSQRKSHDAVVELSLIAIKFWPEWYPVEAASVDLT